VQLLKKNTKEDFQLFSVSLGNQWPQREKVSSQGGWSSKKWKKPYWTETGRLDKKGGGRNLSQAMVSSEHLQQAHPRENAEKKIPFVRKEMQIRKGKRDTGKWINKTDRTWQKLKLGEINSYIPLKET